MQTESDVRPELQRGKSTTERAVPRRRGRPRQPTTDSAILQATIDLLTEVGVDGTTTNAIAVRSGCSKGTIYRRWPSRNELILDALRTAVQGRPDDIRSVVEPTHQVGSPLHVASRRGAKIFETAIFREVFPTIARELLSGGEIGRRFRADVFLPIRAASTARLREAMDRGEIDPTVDPDLVYDLIFGGLLYRTLLGDPMDDAIAARFADLLMSGAAGPRARRASPER